MSGAKEDDDTLLLPYGVTSLLEEKCRSIKEVQEKKHREPQNPYGRFRPFPLIAYTAPDVVPSFWHTILPLIGHMVQATYFPYPLAKSCLPHW